MKQKLDSKSAQRHIELLRQIDIKTVIEYFGGIELLDNMDYLAIANYVMARREDRLYEEVSCDPTFHSA